MTETQMVNATCASGLDPFPIKDITGTSGDAKVRSTTVTSQRCSLTWRTWYRGNVLAGRIPLPKPQNCGTSHGDPLSNG